MVDPFSIATGLAGLVSLTIELVKVSYQYASDVQKASTTVKGFVIELMAFKKLLSELQDAVILDNDVASAFEQRCSSLVELLGVQTISNNGSVSLMDLCKKELEHLLKKLRSQDSLSKLKRAGKRLLWALEGDATQKAIESLHRDREIFSTSVSIDNLKISASMLREIKAIQVDQVERRDEGRIKSILEWLSPLTFDQKQRDIISKRTAGTAQWVLDSPEFMGWYKSSSEGVLWCPGDPGVGKTVDA